MKINNTKNSYLCKYGEYQSNNIDCPAERSVHFVNAILNKLKEKDYKELIDFEGGFGATLQHEIRALYSNTDIEVFWSLGREKEDAEQQASGYDSSIYNELPWMGRLIRSLNKDYHSEPFLHNLIKYTNIAQANIFTIAIDNDGLKLTSYHRDEHHKKGEALDFTVFFKSNDNGNYLPLDFYEYIRHKWKNTYTEAHREEVTQEIRKYLDKWYEYKSHDFLKDINWKDKDANDEPISEYEILDTLYKSYGAVKHFALMSLYMCYKSSKCATYLLSPTIRGKYDSSMVIYWGKSGMSERSFLYLLSMLLGLNASPVLQAQTQSELKQIAFRNTGHVLKNRCQSISGYLKEIEIKELSEKSRDKFISAQSLSGRLVGLFDTLWLWSYDSLSSALNDLEKEPDKRKRYFVENNCDLAEIANSLCDVTAEIRELDGIQKLLSLKLKVSQANRFIINPELSIDENSTKYRLSDEVVKVIFSEIMINAVRHGYINKCESPYVALNITKRSIDTAECICFWNRVNVESSEFKMKYEELPFAWELISQEDTKGLGIAARLLDNLKIGSIWHGKYGDDRYAVAIDMKGLNISDAMSQD
jgi:hypothetical protein